MSPALGPRPALARHVRACEVDGQVILLDLLADRYLGIPQRSGLAQAIDGWPGNPVVDSGTTGQRDLDGVAATLARRGLLVDAPTGTPHTVRPIASPSRSLDALATTGDVHVGPGLFGRFLLSAVTTGWTLRHRSLLDISASLDAARGAAGARGADKVSGELTTLVAVYEHLRPLVFTARDNCLYDSLALHRFLALNGVDATWVIGVRVRPFGAHSWLQVGDTVLNDQRDHVLQFRPILVV
ncbi:MAG: lasso peptide biosynthesis B2 protein [Ideonella sp.]|nr:lasso peptide biosynthesis B2 protein [Ideonella sp.]